MGREPTKARTSLRGAETRGRVLDAAEQLFSQRGYDGTSLRDLAAVAQVRLSLLHYHFGGKDQVLLAAVERKLDTLRAVIQHSFDRAAEARGLDDIASCVRAFILPFLQISADRNNDLHAFVTMTSHLMSGYRLPEVKPALVSLSTVTEVFASRLRAIRPDADPGDLLTAIYLMEAALIFMVQDPGFLDDLSEGLHSSSQLDRIAEPTMRFFTAGIAALLDRTSTK